MVELLIIPALFMGLIIGIYEAILLHRDVSVPTHRFGHMLHALLFAVIATFATMNVPFVYGLFPGLTKIALIGKPLFFQISIGLVALIKIHGVSGAIKSSGGGSIGLKETWTHSLIIVVLIVAAPYIWPLISGLLPAWLQ